VRNLSTHADRLGVDKSFTVRVFVFVCLFAFCVFVRLCIYPPKLKRAASNFSRRFIGVQGRESHIFVNFALPEAQNRTNRQARGPRPLRCKHYSRRHARDAPFVEYRATFGMCGYTVSVPNDVLALLFDGIIYCLRRWKF